MCDNGSQNKGHVLHKLLQVQVVPISLPILIILVDLVRTMNLSFGCVEIMREGKRQIHTYIYIHRKSALEVKLNAPLGNYDRRTNGPTDRPCHRKVSLPIRERER